MSATLSVRRFRFLKFVLSFVLSFSIALSPAVTLATDYPVHKPEFEGQAFEGIHYFPKFGTTEYSEWMSHLATRVKEAEKSNLDRVAESETDVIGLMIEYKNFFLKCREDIYAQIREIGYDEFLKRLDTNLIKYKDPKLGTMEFTTVDGEPVAKTVHNKSGVAFIIYDEDSVDRTSKHFQQYLARQSYDGGSSRKNKKYIDENGKAQKIKAGRDQLIMGIKRDNTINGESIELSPRLRGLKAWLQATYKSPTSYDVRLGVTSGFAQYASVGVLASLIALALPGMEHKDAPELIAWFSFTYGTLIGVWSSFFQNWRSRGSKPVRDIKNMSTSLGYYFGVYLLSGAQISQVTLTDFSIDPAHFVAFAQSLIDNPLTLIPAAHFAHNFWANNEMKSVGYWVADVYKKERSDLGKLPMIWIPYPKKTDEGWSVGFHNSLYLRKRDWNRQFLYYLPGNWIKFVDQVWFAWTLGPTLRGEYPWWTPLLSVAGYWGSVWAGMRGVNYWAYKYHPEAAKELKIREESFYYFYPDKILKKAKDFCSKLLE